MDIYLGIDIGGTKCTAALGSCGAGGEEPTVIDRISFPRNEPAGPEPAIAMLLASARTLVDRYNPVLSATGISCGSPPGDGGGIDRRGAGTDARRLQDSSGRTWRARWRHGRVFNRRVWFARLRIH